MARVRVTRRSTASNTSTAVVKATEPEATSVPSSVQVDPPVAVSPIEPKKDVDYVVKLEDGVDDDLGAVDSVKIKGQTTGEDVDMKEVDVDVDNSKAELKDGGGVEDGVAQSKTEVDSESEDEDDCKPSSILRRPTPSLFESDDDSSTVSFSETTAHRPSVAWKSPVSDAPKPAAASIKVPVNPYKKRPERAKMSVAKARPRTAKHSSVKARKSTWVAQANLRRNHNKLYVIRSKAFYGAYVCSPTNSNKQAYLRPFYDYIMRDIEKRKELQVTHVFDRVDMKTSLPIPADPGQSTSDDRMFMLFCRVDFDGLQYLSPKQWGEKIVQFLNVLGADRNHYQYEATFQFSGDKSVPMDSDYEAPADTYISKTDAFDLMIELYGKDPNNTAEIITHSVLPDFFRNHEAMVPQVKSYWPGEEA